ncbi:cold-responsive protein kinase 1-like [Arachis hypogaea]|uniref:cold-responsive protein kinase 1-like n=1 Tax=Arachis hypogaea TaxID=3818 RepID=UPI0010FC5B2F|nr:cold-responsive protein kinase 1-like [Arachis hypogaea]
MRNAVQAVHISFVRGHYHRQTDYFLHQPAIGGSLPPPPVPLRRFCPLPLAPPLRAGIHPKYFSPQSFLSDQNGGSQTFFHLYAAMPSACTTNTTCEIPGATKLKAPINYKYNDLKAATNNFNGENRLGGGGFGNVYKGTLKNGKVIAAKKLFSVQSKKLEDDFESEVKFLSNVHHRNLVRLLGFCKKGQERIIVYEYMTNGSLDKLLFGKKKGWLNWKQRYDMVLGTARGLAYLHEEFYVSIIHRDIKSGNILLDHELQPKISDFGLARFLPSDQSKLNTRFAGTLGYTAPEYAIYGQLSEKVDTYSYGIVILEIISGRKSTEIVKNNNNDDDDHEYLIKQAWKLYEQGKHLELVDKNLDPNDYDVEEVKRVIEIALMCTQASPSKRPKMSQVVVLLTSKAQLENLQPSMPVFIESNLKSQGSNFGSNATVSDSILSAR